MSLRSEKYGFGIWNPEKTYPGSRGQKGTGSRIRIRNTALKSQLSDLVPDPDQRRWLEILLQVWKSGLEYFVIVHLNWKGGNLVSSKEKTGKSITGYVKNKLKSRKKGNRNRQKNCLNLLQTAAVMRSSCWWNGKLAGILFCETY